MQEVAMNPPVREQIERRQCKGIERFGHCIEDHSRPVGNKATDLEIKESHDDGS
jgi:hypothetical protein